MLTIVDKEFQNSDGPKESPKGNWLRHMLMKGESATEESNEEQAESKTQDHRRPSKRMTC